MKLSKFLCKQGFSRLAWRGAVASQAVRIDGATVAGGDCEIDRFMRIEVHGVVLQMGSRALYLMLHKPVGYLSATKDPEFPTVIDLIDDPDKGSLHLAGRLDRSTSGLVLLTNDGRWSKRLTGVTSRVRKVYRVETEKPIENDAVATFACGFYFHTEDIVTLPALLEIVGERSARVTLWEGRYHQIKRMFHRINNRVTALHRERIGGIELTDDLAPGQWRALLPHEIEAWRESISTGPSPWKPPGDEPLQIPL